MKAPTTRLPIKKLKYLASHRCKHRHTYAEHYSCYLRENPENLRIGFLDIETSNLKANFGIVFCYCILDDLTDEIVSRVVTKKELKKSLDKYVVAQCIKDLHLFDTVVTYYGSRFDLPFLRTRAKWWGLKFPIFGTIRHKDIYYVVKNKFCLNSNRLETACRAIIGSTEKNKVDATHWIRALQGNNKSLSYILDHNERDVRDLKRIYHAVMPYVKETFRSI
jgi:uncharacterized protein YprB with RNaseH-like and TPR domain